MRLHNYALAVIVLSGVIVIGYLTRDTWLDLVTGPSAETPAPAARPLIDGPKVVKLSRPAQKNLSLSVKPISLQSYWRTIQVPGVIVDRPGQSDRGVSAPAVAIVSQVHAFPGDTVKPGDRLFTLRLISEYLQNTQSELFKTTRELQLVKEQHDRLAGLAKSGAVPEAKIIDLDAQMKRLTAVLQSARQDLLTRGLKPEQIAAIAEGKFVSEIEVVVPPRPLTKAAAPSKTDILNSGYEVQELKVELGQQVSAGQQLNVLANHAALFIEGRSFKREAPSLEEAAQQGWPVRVEFAEDKPERWPNLEQTFHIRHLANSIDPLSRTLAFFLPLTNQGRSYEKNGRTHLLWRFRPGQRVQLFVPVEEMKDVIVLPAAAVAREGPEAFVFRQNGELFDRRPVHVLHEDRHSVILANDGSIAPGLYVAQNAAASLNRILKAQAAGGAPAGLHVHPDGTVHGTH